jgi:hypothetical protein
MLMGKDGRVVQLQTPKDDWSRTIKELLEVTGKRTYKRVNIGRRDTPRLSMVSSLPTGLMFHAQSPSFTGNDGVRSKRAISDIFFGAIPLAQTGGLDDEPSESINQNDTKEGISVMIIETQDADQRNE